MDATMATAGQSRLELLSNEVLQNVWRHLGHPGAWARTSKRLRALSKDELWRAKWFMQRYALHEVIFYAIKLPDVFSPSLFQLLVRLGAPLSRNLVQLLHTFHNCVSKDELTGDGNWVDWGNITFLAYVSVMQHAATLYGNEMDLGDVMRFDCIVFSEWMLARYVDVFAGVEPESSEEVRQLFREGFMPLPLALELSEGISTRVCRSDHSADDAIRLDPELTPAAMRNGMLLHEHRIEHVLAKWCQYFPTARFKPFVEDLQHGGVLGISEQFAKSCFEDRLGPEVTAATIDTFIDMYSPQTPEEYSKWEAAKCNLLKELDAESRLPFKLKDVVDEKYYSC